MTHIKVMVGYKAEPEEWAVIEQNWPKECEIVAPKSWDEETIKRFVADVDVVVGNLPAEYLIYAPKLKLVHTTGHGVNAYLSSNVRQYLLEHKVLVLRASPAAIPISEFIMGNMVALTRRTWILHQNLAFRGNWSESIKAKRMKGSMGGELYGSRLGIMGFGSIGQETAKRAKAFGMTIATLTRNPQAVNQAEFGLAACYSSKDERSIEEFLGRCDYLVNTMPLTAETRNFMNSERFAALKDGAYLVNISRGPIIVEEALWQALRSGKLAGAALDVWCCEEFPPELREYPLSKPVHQYNVIMTPHYAGATKEVRERALRTVGENLRRWLNHEPLINVADLNVGY